MAFAQNSCGPDMSPISENAQINFLDVGAYIKFNRDIVLPSFNNKRQLDKGLWISYPPSSSNQKINKGTINKINLVNALDYGYTLELSDSYPITIDQAPDEKIETIRDLKKRLGDIVSFCKRDI